MLDQWVDIYIPETLDDYVWRDAEQRKTVEAWIAEGRMPHVLFSGLPGTGKTSLAYLILRLIGIPDEDILYINASKHRVVEAVEKRIGEFVSTYAFNHTGIKYVIFDEADKLSDTTQGMLRGETEQHSDVCRFIFTCNRLDKISGALKSRCQGFTFTALEKDQYILRAAKVLMAEKVDFSDELLFEYVDACYPDLRMCLGLLQQNSKSGTLAPLSKDDLPTKDYLLQAVQLFAQGQIGAARKMIVENASAEDYDDVYRFFYENLELWGDTEVEQGNALLVIRDAIVNHAVVADVEINLAAALVELMRIRK